MFYTIDRDNVITAFATDQEVQASIPPTGFDVIASTEKQLAKAAAEWPISRFAEIWNGFAGVAGPFGDLKPVKKFENRAKAVARIWVAIQRLGAQVEAAAATPAPPKAKRAARKDAVVAPTAAAPLAPETKAKAPREGSQTAKVIALLKQDGGVTLDAIMAATGWQKHSCRGFISTLPKKTGLVITSIRRESDKARVYAAQ
jgi:hypothetical protein